jgi:hypothetical protein
MKRRGQAVIEYVLLLVVFTAAAVSGWKILRPALGDFYEGLSQRRSGLKGMFP